MMMYMPKFKIFYSNFAYCNSYIEEFQKPLLMHWYGEIDFSDLTRIIPLVVKKRYSLDDAIDIILNEEL